MYIKYLVNRKNVNIVWMESIIQSESFDVNKIDIPSIIPKNINEIANINDWDIETIYRETKKMIDEIKSMFDKHIESTFNQQNVDTSVDVSYMMDQFTILSKFTNELEKCKKSVLIINDKIELYYQNPESMNRDLTKLESALNDNKSLVMLYKFYDCKTI